MVTQKILAAAAAASVSMLPWTPMDSHVGFYLAEMNMVTCIRQIFEVNHNVSQQRIVCDAN